MLLRAGGQGDLGAGWVGPIGGGRVGVVLLRGEEGFEEGVSGLSGCFAGRHLEIRPQDRVQAQDAIILEVEGGIELGIAALQHWFAPVVVSCS